MWKLAVSAALLLAQVLNVNADICPVQAYNTTNGALCTGDDLATVLANDDNSIFACTQTEPGEWPSFSKTLTCADASLSLSCLLAADWGNVAGSCALCDVSDDKGCFGDDALDASGNCACDDAAKQPGCDYVRNGGDTCGKAPVFCTANDACAVSNCYTCFGDTCDHSKTAASGSGNSSDDRNASFAAAVLGAPTVAADVLQQAYTLPEEVWAACVGASSCDVGAVASPSSGTPVSVTWSANGEDIVTVSYDFNIYDQFNQNPNFKLLAYCA